jgi:hypothetical protein
MKKLQTQKGGGAMDSGESPEPYNTGGRVVMRAHRAELGREGGSRERSDSQNIVPSLCALIILGCSFSPQTVVSRTELNCAWCIVQETPQRLGLRADQRAQRVGIQAAVDHTEIKDKGAVGVIERIERFLQDFSQGFWHLLAAVGQERPKVVAGLLDSFH